MYSTIRVKSTSFPSTDEGEPYYPAPNVENKESYTKRYQEMTEKEEGVTFVGRLATYKYFNIASDEHVYGMRAFQFIMVGLCADLSNSLLFLQSRTMRS